MIAVVRLEPADWQRARSVRLRALGDSPDAFAVRLEEDEAQPPSRWRARLENPDAVTFVAEEQGADVGLVVGAGHPEQKGTAGLYAMWVAPEARSLGVGGSLVDAVVAWARSAGYRRVVLEVGDENLAAIRLYESRGFVRTGATNTMPPPRTHILEHERALDLSG